MTCAQNVEPEAAERYVLGQMTEPELSAFEEHYFACDECFATVQALQDLQGLLRGGGAADVNKDESIGVTVPNVDAPPSEQREQPQAQTVSQTPPPSAATVTTRHEPLPFEPRSNKPKVKTASASASSKPVLLGLAVAASLLIAAVLWQRQSGSTEPSTTVAKNEPVPSTPGTSGTSTPATGGTPVTPGTPAGGSTAGTGSTASTGSAASTPSPSTTTPSTKPETPPARRLLDLGALAMIVPPPYVPLKTRGAEGSSQTETFQSAMASYSAKDYAAAAAGLRTVVDANPSDARAQFFLGVASLMTGDDAAASAALEQAAASGAAPFASEAHFYLAKTALRQKDLARAERELKIAVEQEAGPAGEAESILRQLRQAGQR